ncbi:MAG: ABC transporter substrate-binding protein [Bacteroidaceae bacterium]|nr:ABC transporter substrate-binding protein [Bacteroidaceae bacterium]
MKRSDLLMSYIKNIFLLFTLLSLFCAASCGGRGEISVGIVGDTLRMRNSSLLTMVECDGYTVVDVANPWGKNLLSRYILVPSDSALPANLPHGNLLRTPLQRVVLFSGVHACLLQEIGASGAIAGVCDSRYMYCSAVADGLAAGGIVDCGSSLNVDCEAVLQTGADAVFTLPYENGGYGRLGSLGVPLVQCADYMENTPLGCAEWMRFYGRLFGKGELCDSLFAIVCAEYDSLCVAASAVGVRPKLMCEMRGSSAWYVPAGESTMGRMYADAGADYLFSSYEGSGSVPLSYEVVLDKAADADVWLLKYNSLLEKSLRSLQEEFAGYSHFAPFKNRCVYACNTHSKHLFEETSFHPERLLKELVAILHPHLFPNYKCVYYEKMR